MAGLFQELKRRNVVRVGIAYVVLGWVALQAADILFDLFEAPIWVGKSFAALLLLGFPFALLFAWAFELTPEGIKKTAEVDASRSVTHSTGRKLDYVIIATLVVVIGFFIWDRQHAPDAPETVEGLDRSIAVLPFVNMSSDQEQEWFADGLTEEILNSLARTPDLLVASRTSSFQYKGKTDDISSIARALGVAHILEGSVRRGGDRLRVTAQLIRASDGFHLWSETFDRKPEDVIQIQEDVAFEIAEALQTAMDPQALKEMVSAGTASVAAYEAYLEGLALEAQIGSTGNVENWEPALTAYTRATAIDPTFGAAYWRQAVYWESELSITNIGQGYSGRSGEEIAQLYKEAMGAAIRATDDETQRLKLQAFDATVDMRYREAVRYSERFLAEHPYDISGLNDLMFSLTVLRDLETAKKYVSQIRRTTKDDPEAYNVLLNNTLFAGLEEEALMMVRDMLLRFPNHAYLLYQGHRVLLWNGAVDEARPLIDLARQGDFEQDSIQLMLLRQACAEADNATAAELHGRLTAPDQDISIRYIANILFGRPVDAHRLLIDAELDVKLLRSFLNYPYFDDSYFPELVAILAPQGIRRTTIEGPPYTCKQAATSSPES